MEKYAPHLKDLSSRDVVSRASIIEIREGRGCGPRGDHVLLKLNHLPEEVFEKRLPGITELAITFAGVDPRKEPIPVAPTCHYMMGGIPTNIHGQVLTIDKNGKDKIIEGLYAAGECACVSVHGANRLGANSLLDIVVFGRSIGLHLEEALIQKPDYLFTPDDEVERAYKRLIRWDASKDGEDFYKVRDDLQKVMEEDFGVFRTEEAMSEGLEKLQKIRERVKHAVLPDKSKIFNTARIEALELDNLMEVAIASAVLAENRKESRGAHSRLDYPERDDKNWLKHSLYFEDGTVGYRPVNLSPREMSPIEPKERPH
jgi:succinate dehydrogenase / fumarate reductase flavoprotein subunit